MRILFITSTFPRSIHDDQVPWLAEFVRKLKEKGVQPVVYAPSYKGLATHEFFGIPVIRFRYGPKELEILTHEEGAIFKLRQKPWLFILAFFYLLFGIIGIFRLSRHHSFDVIHVQWPFPNGIFGIVAKRLFRAKLTLTFHGAEFTLASRIPLGGFITKTIMKQANAIIANSTYTKNMIQHTIPMDVSIIPFGSAITGTTQGYHQVHRQAKVTNILFVGRFIEKKGVTYLIDAAEILRKRQKSISLSIVGSGDLAGEIRSQIHRLDLDQIIKVYENLDKEEIAQFYRWSDIFVLPSIVDRWNDTETLGVVLIEAMTFGKPVVASRVGGIPDVVKHNKNGILVAEKDPQALADAIEKLIQEPELRRRLGRNGLQFVKNHYNWKSIIDKTRHLYFSP